jgi:hypothetical protein
VKTTAKLCRATCQTCGRTVHIVSIDGIRTALDAEVITIVPHAGEPMKIHARRVHAELCMSYKSERERKQARALMRRGARQ